MGVSLGTLICVCQSFHRARPLVSSSSCLVVVLGWAVGKAIDDDDEDENGKSGIFLIVLVVVVVLGLAVRKAIDEDDEHENDWGEGKGESLRLLFGFRPKKRIEIGVQNLSSENESVGKPDLQGGANFFSDRSACKIRFGNDDFQTNQTQRIKTE